MEQAIGYCVGQGWAAAYNYALCDRLVTGCETTFLASFQVMRVRLWDNVWDLM